MQLIRTYIDVLTSLTRMVSTHYRLIWELARREWRDRSAGQLLGGLWIVGIPLIQIAIYLFLFQFVFNIRVTGMAHGGDDYAVYLLAGLIPWLAIQETMNKACSLLPSNANLVKQVVFPIEVLPIKTVVVVLVPQLISFSLLVVYVLVTQAHVRSTYALLPGVIVVQAVGMVGIAYIVSAVGVFLCDLREMVPVACLVGLYMLPVFYQPEMVPTFFQPLLYLNPFSYLIWCYQDICFYGSFVHPWAWGVVLVGNLGLLLFGYLFFQRLKGYFGQCL